MAEVVEDIMEHDEEIDKREASPNASEAPNPKRFKVVEFESDSSDEIVSPTPETKPHIFLDDTVLEYFFFDERFVEVLAKNVYHNSQLRQLLAEIMHSLRKAYAEGLHSCWVGIFAAKVNDLFDRPDFFKACGVTYFEEEYCRSMSYCIDIYKDEKEPYERMESLMGDYYLKHILEDESGSFSIARVVMSVLFGYWSDDALYTKVHSAIILADQQRKQPSTTPDEIVYDMSPNPVTKPHILLHQTIMQHFYNDEKSVEVVAEKVEHNSQLRQLIDEIMDFLRKAYVEGIHSSWVGIFAAKVKELFDHPDFLKACTDSYFEDEDCCYMSVSINIYQNEKHPHERMKSLMDDSYLKGFFEDETGSFSIARVVLSVLFGYWSDAALYTKVHSAINYVSQQMIQPSTSPSTPEFRRSGNVSGIKYPANVEGLKTALHDSMYPEDEVNFMCEQIDENMYQYDYRLPGKGKVITSFDFILGDNRFYMPLIELSDDDEDSSSS